MDVHDKKTRSYNMSMIKNKNTKPEVLIRKYLFANGFRFKINDKRYPGHPDIVLPKYKTCIFVNGCFWHVHEGCRYFVWPESNKEFWRKKLTKNIDRDRRNYKQLNDMGWNIIVVWECEIKKDKIQDTLARLKNVIEANGTKIAIEL